MKWRGRRGSSNIVDRRGGGGGTRGGGRSPFSFGGGSLGGGSLGGGFGRGKGGLLGLIVVVAVAIFFGGGLETFLGGGDGQQQGGTLSERTGPGTQTGEELKEFVSVVLADTEEVWHAEFQRNGLTYHEPKLVLFSGGTQSGCGFAQSAVGPFYCPADSQVYLDLDFFEELSRRFGAPGDFAQAYVIAHEVGHHIQAELGILQKVHEAQSRASQTEANQLSVRLELQADCLAGVFAKKAEAALGVLEPGDIAEALTAAAAIGDDELQRQSSGHVRPDSFTHGTSAQRQKWFETGYRGGDMNVCDTFTPASP